MKIISKIFIGSLVFFLVFFVLELVKEGFVSNHLDLNVILLIVFIFGAISLLLNKNDKIQRSNDKSNPND